ncbi:response regulator transcription factor [Brevundimonas sp.]|uniref:response regulator transcription factor n=1 Tax=Brevundimonas sp. TaxID=1871086 RepID=UPI00272F7189|nr:response regulator [Brevundimonas sp.]MDP1912903.1 response regulator [Brevundimonas sp.]
MSPSVFVIDDDPSVRDAIVLLLRKEGVRVRAFTSGQDFFDRLPDDAVACVITDLRMPGINGAEVVQRLTELRGTSWAIIVITAHADVPIAVSLMRSGAIDFIEKPFDPQRLIETVKGCLNHLGSTGTILEARSRALRKIELLTPRELQVFDHLVEGLSNKEIARRLKISPRTVEVFRAKVMAKTEVGSLSALVQMSLFARSVQRRS